MRLDFGFTGMPASGKSTSGDYLESRHNFSQFMGSDFLQQRASEQGITLASRAEFAAFYREQKLLLGASFIAEQSLKMPGERVANVGIRTRDDVGRFLNAGGILIGLACDLPTRFERSAGTNPKYPSDLRGFMVADALENSTDGEMDVQYAINAATHTIDNNGTVDQLYQQLDDIVHMHNPGK